MNKFSFLLAALCVSLNAQEAKPADSKAAPAPELKLAGGAKAEQKTSSPKSGSARASLIALTSRRISRSSASRLKN